MIPRGVPKVNMFTKTQMCDNAKILWPGVFVWEDFQ